MAATQTAEKSGGTGVYAIGLVVLLLLIGGLLYFRGGDETTPPTGKEANNTPPPEPPKPIHAPPPPPEVEDEVEDAGVDAAPPEKTGKVASAGGGACANCGKGKSSPALNSALSSTAASAQGCYNRALRNSAVSGSLMVSVQVGAGGTVCGASIVNDSVGSPEISSCVQGRFAGKKFPAPAEGCVVVNIPISFAIRD